MPDALPRRIGRYEALSVIGEGGAGTVYRAVDPTIGRAVAIKVLRTHAAVEQARFVQEARAAGRLQHPNVATLFDVGRTEADEVFVVQEIVEGENLARLLARHPNGLPSAVATGLLLQVAQALAHAHGQGLVHHDVKPGNVVVTAQGAAKLLDFGTARIVPVPEGVPLAAAPVGTPRYMAPEVIRGEGGDERADIWSFGVLAFELLTGRTPFDGDNSTALMMRTLEEPAPRVTTFAPSCPPRLAALVQACLEKDPAERPPSMGDVVVILAGMPAAWDPSLLATPGDNEAALGRSRRIVPFEPGGDPTPPVVRPHAPAAGFETPMPGGPIPGAPAGGAPIALGGTAAPLPPAAWPAASTGVPSADTPPPIDPYDPTGFLTPPSIAPLHTPQAMQPAPGTDLSGRTVGRFTLHERVARGRTGDLYKAFDPVRSTLVGVKVVHAADAEAQQRLMRGGGAWLRLHHPNVLRVLEVHPAMGHQPALIVSELAGGLPLDRLAGQRDLAVEDAVWIAMQVCDALATVHAHGVVHREVRPANVVVAPRDLHVTLLDPGLARDANPEADAHVRDGALADELAYVAPEQAQGRVDSRTDVYAVGALLHELLLHQRVPFPLPAGWRPDLDAAEAAGVPAALVAIVERALRPDPRARYGSVLALHDALRAFAHVHEGTGERHPVIALHGLGTPRSGALGFAHAGARARLDVRVEGWGYGHLSALRLLLPRAGRTKTRWLRRTYRQEFGDTADAQAGGLPPARPSIVAHRLGTWILGQALIRDPDLRFDKVLLVDSVLPRGYAWDRILERGQVQAVRHEIGHDGAWARALGWFVPGTGTSGTEGFTSTHPQLQQERIEAPGARAFDPAHVIERWLPFLTARGATRPAQSLEVEVPQGQATPWALYAIYVAVAIACAASIVLWR
jgi:serine/threonine-protein kinase